MSFFPLYSSQGSSGSLGGPRTVFQSKRSGSPFNDLSRAPSTEVAVSPSMSFPVGATRRYGQSTNILSVKKGAPYTRAGNQHIPSDLIVRKKYYDKVLEVRAGKSGDAAFVTNITSTGQNLGCLNDIARRSDDPDKADTERIGDKVVVTGLDINMALYQSYQAITNLPESPSIMNKMAQNAPNSYRIVIFIDTSTQPPTAANGQATTPTDIITSSAASVNRRNSFNALRNMSHTRRIQVLWDKTIDCNPVHASIYQINGNAMRMGTSSDVRVFRLSFGMRLPVEFRKSTVGSSSVDNIKDNSIQVAIWAVNDNHGTDIANYMCLQVYSRLRFLDD